MKNNIILLSVFILLIVLIGCAASQLNPVTSEDRIVKPIINQDKRLVLKESMVWYDRAKPTRGILLPEGIYILQAEDSEYNYFKAPKDLEYRVFKNGEVIDSNFMPGGLFLTKVPLSIVPAGSYLSVTDKHKALTWKLGEEFMVMEGTKWEKNF